jgi:hypothetical protein
MACAPVAAAAVIRTPPLARLKKPPEDTVTAEAAFALKRRLLMLMN